MDVYLLALHEPYRETRHPQPINATIVHADTLRHSDLPQPDGVMMYRCLVEAPGREAGTIVPLATLTYELDGGHLWPQIGDWEAVVDGMVALARRGACDSMPIGLPDADAFALGMGPTTELRIVGADPLPSGYRDRILRQLRQALDGFVTEGPFWPGGDLVMPPRTPDRMPYKPYNSKS